MEIFWLWSFFAFVILVHAQDQTDFISIDCGRVSNPRYTDETTRINYVSDEKFINGGISMNISSEYSVDLLEQQYSNVRTFPEGNRHCYTLNPARGKGDRYLIRASFMYGNYDGKNELPEFDIYLGVNKWETVKLDSASSVKTKEIIHSPPKNYIYVCLVNIGAGTPFISALELRVLKNTTYWEGGFDSLSLFTRINAGSNDNRTIRYGDDIYDRIWKMQSESNFGDSRDLISTGKINLNDYSPPSIVMASAVTKINVSSPLEFFWTTESPTAKYFAFLYFAEVELLEANQTREFNITSNGRLIFGPLMPDSFTTTVYNVKPFSGNEILFTIIKTKKSTLPPILNAVEIYVARDLTQSETDQSEVDAIVNVKSIYGVTRNWQGDPCAPKGYPWIGLNCSFQDFDPPHITSLNLSSSGLTGEISISISNFTLLQVLDLSNNSLSGEIPNFLSQLASLKILNLKGNNLSSSIPAKLIERSQKGLLALSVDASSNNCTSCKAKKSNSIIPIVASVIGVLFVILVSLSIVWFIKRKKQGRTDVQELKDKDESLEIANQQFTYSDVVKITNNFEKVLGKGGFGEVYHGILDDKTEVAVKMLSKSSGQGYKEFQAEVKLLMRVHHRNLTALVGYCNDDTNKALIYELMANGSLDMYISDKSAHILSWEDRLRIVVDSAQGLEYLHKGCKPPIVHRDVKCANILLNENFQAKMADFGLSRAFTGEGETHVSTVVAGTPGYLDPEYYATNWLSEKSDVYSFGMVILVIITCRPVITNSRENANIKQWVSFMLEKGDINNIVDSRLNGKFNINSVWKAVEIAMECVSITSAKRPNMTQVVTELKECLALEIAQSDSKYDGNDSKYSNEMDSRTYDSVMTPFAR